MPMRILLLVIFCGSCLGDWPMLRGSATHRGFVEGNLAAPFRLAWAVEFENERLGTAVEPIVSGRSVFIGTHAGSLYALDIQSGKALWRFAAPGPFLHSPACTNGLVICATAEGSIYALDAVSGALVWRHAGPVGGFSAAPIVGNGRIFIGSRSGELIALNLDGGLMWNHQLPTPIRQTAAFHKGQVFVTAEDLRLRSFDEAGNLLWTSEPMFGQTARDYYPVVVEQGGKTYVINRTNPLLTMSQQIARDRTVLARNAGFDDSGWKNVDTWIRSGRTGTPELWEKEQQAIIRHLQQSPDAETFYLFDAASGKRAGASPVLWIGGCQSVGAPPTVTRNGDLFVFHRSAYGNWNHGVAPLVALGLLNPKKNRIAPLFHQSGTQPPWNTFWGTADESQNFVVAGDTVLIVHQGTLSGFDLRKKELFKIHGERDTFGGFRNPAWARNEWHGPARSGVAISEGRIFWQTGSRVLCVVSGVSGKAAELQTVSANAVRTIAAPAARLRSRATLVTELNRVAEEILSRRWKPLFVDPGLHGREFLFGESRDYFEAFAAAQKFLAPELKKRAADFLDRESKEHPPNTPLGRYSLTEGEPREWFQVPDSFRVSPRIEQTAHPLGDLHAAPPSARKTDLTIQWWKNAARNGTLRSFDGSKQLDPFITGGDTLSFKVAPHRHKIALFQNLSNDAFRDVLEAEPEAVSEVWNIFVSLYKTWPLQGEERQVHFGENFVDPPDLALGAFKVMGWLGENSLEDLNRALDLPFCRADVFYLHKLALLLGN